MTDLSAAPGSVHFMLLPSLACNAACSYCFGPHAGPLMTSEILAKSVDCMAVIAAETGQHTIPVTFHGGEPLLAGVEFFEETLSLLLDHFGKSRLHLALQSNLWLLDETLCRLFRKFGVKLGTSLDGPENLTDKQRGTGYFSKTMNGIRTARQHGLRVNAIATFTPQSCSYWKEIIDFFIDEQLDFSIHPSVPRLSHRAVANLNISAQQYGLLLGNILAYYIEHRHRIKITSLDQMCRLVGHGMKSVCTFRDCSKMFLAFDPQGNIYPCQRFCGNDTYRLGSVFHPQNLKKLRASSVHKMMAERQQRVEKECKNCPYLDYCNGGCWYNALSQTNTGSDKDPYCPAYKEIFRTISERLLAEMGSAENIVAVASGSQEGNGNPLLKCGAMIDITGLPGGHPADRTRTAKTIIAATYLAREKDIAAAAEQLYIDHYCDSVAKGTDLLEKTQQNIRAGRRRRNNLYLYITNRCFLRCTHCYYYTDNNQQIDCEMPVEDSARIIQQASDTGFRQVVILGGEPTYHRQFNVLLERLKIVKRHVEPLNLVLRTNFAGTFSDREMLDMARSFHQVVVSVDGDQTSHDARRGAGTYQRVVENLQTYRFVTNGLPDRAELSLACVMSSAEILSEPGAAVRRLAEELEIRRTRFRPVLPLGRAGTWREPPIQEAHGTFVAEEHVIAYGFTPVSTCGLGQNVYVDPSGDVFPCYADRAPHAVLGNVIDQGVNGIVNAKKFTALQQRSVDNNPKCRTCDVRYLCGGLCQAWGGAGQQGQPMQSTHDCRNLEARARSILQAAEAFLQNSHAYRGQPECLR